MSLGSQPSGGADEDEPDTTEEISEDQQNEPEETHDEDGAHHDEETPHEEGTHDEDGTHHDKETPHEEGTYDEEGEHHEEKTVHEDTHNEEGEHHEEETAHEEDEHGHDHDDGMPDEPSESAEVTLATENQEYHFKPHLVWIEPGGTVTWRLESGSQDAVAYHPDNDKPRRMPEAAEPWQIELLSEEGTTAEHTFETEGVYDYYCTPHESLGMVGTVIVGNPDPHDQPALEDPRVRCRRVPEPSSETSPTTSTRSSDTLTETDCSRLFSMTAITAWGSSAHQ